MKRCCTGLGTLWKVSRAGEILWRRDHFASWDAGDDVALAEYLAAGHAPPSRQATCVSCDDAGNVIVGATPSRAARLDPDADQPPMWTVRRYSPAGELRWSGAAEPFGWFSELASARLLSPMVPWSVRLAPSGQGHAFGPPPALTPPNRLSAWTRCDGRGRIRWTSIATPLDNPTPPPALDPDYVRFDPMGHSRSWFLFHTPHFYFANFAPRGFSHEGELLQPPAVLFYDAITSSQADAVAIARDGVYTGTGGPNNLLDPSPTFTVWRSVPPDDPRWTTTDAPLWTSQLAHPFDPLTGVLLLAAPDYVAVIDPGSGAYSVLFADTGRLAARGTVGDDVPSIDGQVIPPTTEGLGWALAGGAMYDDDGRPLWKPAGVTVRDTAIDGDENCYFATDRGVLTIDRLDR